MAKSDKKQKSKKQPKFIRTVELAQHVADYLERCAFEVIGGNDKTLYLHNVMYAVIMDKVIEPLQYHPVGESENAEDGAVPKYADDLNPESVFSNIYKRALASKKFERSLKNCIINKNMHLATGPKDEDWLQHISIGSFYTAGDYNFNGVGYTDFAVVPFTILAVPVSKERLTNGVVVG